MPNESKFLYPEPLGGVKLMFSFLLSENSKIFSREVPLFDWLMSDN